MAICVLHFIFLLYFFSPAISTPDAQGYFTQGKIIAKYGHTYFTPQNNLQYIGPHWHSLDEQRYFATFPPGFPCLIAIAYKLFGANSTFLINLILASVSLLIFFFLCRNWLSDNWSLAATFFLAINPFYNEHALFGDSHTSLIFFFLLALLFLIKTIRTNNPIYPAPQEAVPVKTGINGNGFPVGFFPNATPVKAWCGVYGILSGIAIGIVPTIRYAEFALCFIFGCYILWLSLARKISIKTFISVVIGVLIPLLPLGIHNQIAFGKFWATGYGFSSAPASFGFNYLIEHFMPFLIMLVTAGMGILLPLSIIGFVNLLRKSDTRWTTAYLLSSTIILTLLYMAYSWPPDPQSMRFLLPTFPIYTIAAVYFMSRLSKNYRIALLSIAILVSLPWGVLGFLRAVTPLHMQNSVLENITKAVEKNISEKSIIMTSEGICQNLDVYDKWKLIDISILSKADTTHDERPMKPIRNEYASRLYDSLSGYEFKDQLLKDLNQWSSGKIFLIAYESDIKTMKNIIGNRFTFDKKALIETANFDLPVRKDFTHHNKNLEPGHPGGPNHIFDFEIRKEPLVIVESTIK